MSNQTSMHDKIRNLLALANHESTNEAEAMAAMNAAQRLMSKYRISLGEVEEKDETFGQVWYSTKHSYGSQNWSNSLMNVIGKENGVYVVVDPQRKRVMLFGTQDEINIVKTLFDYCFNYILVSGKRAWKAGNYQNRNAFWNGYATGAVAGFKSTMVKATADEGCTALVANRYALVREKCTLETRTSKQRRTKQYGDAYSKGYADGQGIKPGISSTAASEKRRSHLIA